MENGNIHHARHICPICSKLARYVADTKTCQSILVTAIQRTSRINIFRHRVQSVYTQATNNNNNNHRNASECVVAIRLLIPFRQPTVHRRTQPFLIYGCKCELGNHTLRNPLIEFRAIDTKTHTSSYLRCVRDACESSDRHHCVRPTSTIRPTQIGCRRTIPFESLVEGVAKFPGANIYNRYQFSVYVWTVDFQTVLLLAGM